MEPHYRASFRFVLVAPSHPGNIGASARAIATMGFDRLVVVADGDHDFKAAPEARALAVSAAGVLDAAQHCASLEQALAGVTVAFAMTGYDREYGPPLVPLREAAGAALGHAARGAGEIAFVFGTERTGLANRDVERCQFCCAIPAAPEHASLNLAQAVQVAAYECRMAGLAAADPQATATLGSRFEAEAPAAVDELEGMYATLERGLIALGVLDPAAPRRTMPRLRRLFARAHPSAADVALLRGVFAAMIERKADRPGRRGLPR